MENTRDKRLEKKIDRVRKDRNGIVKRRKTKELKEKKTAVD